MEESDLSQVSAMEKRCFHDPWPEASLARELTDNPFSCGWVLEQDGEIAAYAFCWEVFERAEISNIAVKQEARRQGLAREMMQFLMAKSREDGCEFMNLEARVSNLPAIALYESLGFQKVAQVKHYYDDGEDAVYMSTAL